MDLRVRQFCKGIRLNLFPILILTPAFLYLLAFLVVVIDRLLILSLTSVGPDLQKTFPTVAVYADLATSPEFRDALLRTVIFTLIGTPVQLAVGLILALLITREFRGRGLVRSVFILPLAIPGIVVAIVLWIMTNYPFGHINDLLMGKIWFLPQLVAAPVNWRGNHVAALGVSMFGKIWHDMPISMLILLAGLQSIGDDQYEAASMLGAGAWSRFRFITLPLLVPAMSTVLVLRSIEMWKEFVFPFVLAPRYPLLATLIEQAYHEWNEPGTAAALSIVLFACITAGTIAIFLMLKWLGRRLVRV